VLRDFQVELKAETYRAWHEGARVVMPVMATGGGKTVVFCDIVKEMDQPACLISHRQELVGQAALALNREEVQHGIIAPAAIQKQIIQLEMEMHGRSFYSPRAPVRVAGVDTLLNHDTTDRWLQQVGLIVQDEGHHVLKDNKWGSAMEMFSKNARGLFPTAHAYRADGKGLGRSADGLVDRLVLGPHGRELINRGFLCDYRLIAPPDTTDMSDVNITGTGDFSPERLRIAIHRNKSIVGDVVAHYMRFAAGKLGITFAVDIEAATEIAAGYRKAGIPAEIITAKTPLFVRGQLMRQFRARQILQLVSVDVLGEGVDVPAVEVVSMARHTASFQLYAQQFGRALRIMVTDQQNREWGGYTDQQRLALIAASVKPAAIIIDHVNNYQRHGLPDVEQTYKLTRREKRSRGTMDDAIPLRPCLNEACALYLQPYPVVLPGCPECGTKPPPQRRGTPDQVEGDLVELDPAALAALRGEIARIDNPAVIPRGADNVVAQSIRKRHAERQDAQATLRAAWQLWQGWQLHQGRGEREGYQRFWFKFGTDVATAHALGVKDAADLEARIRADLLVNNVVALEKV
jgi:superfamily II DNA or RNA helicase